MLAGESTVLVTAMKNEGPYILEWVAHHLAAGIDRFIVISNDCDDLTDRILDRLSRLIALDHAPNPMPLVTGLTRWQLVALDYARLMNSYRDAGWLYVSDVDEFLQIKVGDGTLDALAAAAGRFDAVSFSSVPFGSSGVKALADLPVVTQFTRMHRNYRRREKRGRAASNAVKTLFRAAVPFAHHFNHRPLLDDFSARGLRWIDGSGRDLPPDFTDGTAKVLDAIGATDLAQMNHYALRSAEAFLIKMDRGDVMGQDRLSPERRYWEDYDAEGNEDRSFVTPRPGAQDWLARLSADAVLAELHRQSFALHVAKAARLRTDPAMAAMLPRLGLTGE